MSDKNPGPSSFRVGDAKAFARQVRLGVERGLYAMNFPTDTTDLPSIRQFLADMVELVETVTEKRAEAATDAATTETPTENSAASIEITGDMLSKAFLARAMAAAEIADDHAALNFVRAYRELNAP